MLHAGARAVGRRVAPGPSRGGASPPGARRVSLRARRFPSRRGSIDPPGGAPDDGTSSRARKRRRSARSAAVSLARRAKASGQPPGGTPGGSPGPAAVTAPSQEHDPVRRRGLPLRKRGQHRARIERQVRSQDLAHTRDRLPFRLVSATSSTSLEIDGSSRALAVIRRQVAWPSRTRVSASTAIRTPATSSTASQLRRSPGMGIGTSVRTGTTAGRRPWNRPRSRTCGESRSGSPSG